MKNIEEPWKYRPAIATNCFYIETVDQSHERSFIGEVGGGLQSEQEILANAKLIAAAPDLLKSCLSLIQQAEACNYHTSDGLHALIDNLAIREIKTAIKKATE